MVNWTGRDIDNCAAKADLLDISMVEASTYVVPLLESHRGTIEGIRSSAHNRFLSASHEGLYQYVKAPAIVHEVKTTVSDGRKFRT